MSIEATHRAVEAVWRIESARLIAALARRVGDIGMAEDLAQDALLAALERWPDTGIPDNPGAWLMAAAKHRAIDHFRRAQRIDEKHARIGGELMDAEREAPDFDTPLDDEIGDDLLRLIFTACHPVLSTEARVALTLRLLGGLTTEEIARAFLVPTSTVAQRIVRAKRTLADARVPFEVPRGHALEERLASVLEVVYLVFNEGYSATAGEDWVRPALCEDAQRRGRVLAELAPAEPEVHGLVALMEIQASRLRSERSLSVASSDRRMPCASGGRGRHRLGADRRALGRALAPHPLARRRVEPGRGGREGVRSGGGTRDCGRARRRARTRVVPSPPGGARRLPHRAGTPG